ncbi:MAG: hypothetical protein M3071_19480 [Actinomycetota bacterium]|nr:hypothetical protein [Actinomycetota bacterium]
MKVTWVHPSWRDLVIEHLSSDAEARVHFLRHCAVHGALLALSSAGGARGRRRLPLLKRDADWDALTDRLYELAPDLEQAELIGVLDALRSARAGREVVPDRAEREALVRAVLVRLTNMWKSARVPIAVPVLEAWLAVGRRLSPPPPPPALGVTWAELLPASAPDFSDRACLERFADWLTLAELLRAYDPKLLGELGFPGQAHQHCEGFVHALERDIGRIRTRDIDQAVRAIVAMSMLGGPLAERAYALRHRLEMLEYADIGPALDMPRPRDVESSRRTGHLDVQRVLADL